MNERRRNKRTNMPSKIVMKRLDGNTGKEVTINILDVSKSGIGFECAEVLQIGEVYEAHLTLWTHEVLHALLQIVRIELRTGGYDYGAIFVGMGETDLARIETYQTVSELNGEGQ